MTTDKTQANLIVISDKPPSLEDAQAMVGGYVEFIPLEDGSQMLVNEDGTRLGLPFNKEATLLAFGLNPHARIVGTAIILKGKALWD